MSSLNEFLVPYVISNLIALALVWICWKRSHLGIILFGILFILAGLINLYMATFSPEVYQEYATGVLFEFYADFIRGFFKDHAALLVTLVALGQLITGTALFIKKQPFRSIGSTLGILFLISIAPLGIGSAFPATLIMAMALFTGYKKTHNPSREKIT
jgi:hypothetical protein